MAAMAEPAVDQLGLPDGDDLALETAASTCADPSPDRRGQRHLASRAGSCGGACSNFAASSIRDLYRRPAGVHEPRRAASRSKPRARNCWGHQLVATAVALEVLT